MGYSISPVQFNITIFFFKSKVLLEFFIFFWWVPVQFQDHRWNKNKTSLQKKDKKGHNLQSSSFPLWVISSHKQTCYILYRQM